MREFGSEHPGVILPDGYLENFSQYGYITWLRTGREGLYYVAQGIKRKNNPVVLFPAYCCWSMSAPFQKAGWKVVYYRLNQDLTVDLDFLKHLLNEQQPDAVLTMNFYGSARTDDAVSVVKHKCPDCVIVEDFSHCTFSLEAIYNSQVDFYVTSVRKSVGVTDGGIVIGKKELDSSLINKEITPFTTNRREAQLSKSRYAFSQSEKDKSDFLSVLRGEEHRLDEFDSVNTISDTGKKMIAAINGAEIRYARSQNMKHAIARLSGKVKMVPRIEKCIEGAPFSLPILVDERDNVQKQLASKGVYAPVLWPICDEARNVCPVSAYVSDHMLSIPIDQRYSYDDIEDITSIVLDICS
jgi:hypothetical protein